MNFLTVGNQGYLDFQKHLALNFKKEYLRKHQLHIVCTDAYTFNQLGTFLRRHQCQNAILSLAPLGLAAFANYNTPHFFRITHHKFCQIVELVEKNDEIIYVDGDIALFKDPEVAVRQKPQADIIFQSDNHENPYDTNQCTGYFYARKNPQTLLFLKEICDRLAKNPGLNDQEVLGQYFKELGVKDVRQVKQVAIDVFNPIECQNGFIAFQKGQYADSRRITIHANYRIGAVAKKVVLIQCGGWFLKDGFSFLCYLGFGFLYRLGVRFKTKLPILDALFVLMKRAMKRIMSINTKFLYDY